MGSQRFIAHDDRVESGDWWVTGHQTPPGGDEIMTGQLDHGGVEDHWAWGVEWVWVGGYSAASTTIILLNFSLFIAVIRNRYLHYSFNYVVFALALRNICRVVFTLYLVFIAKLSQSKYPNELVSTAAWSHRLLPLWLSAAAV